MPTSVGCLNRLGIRAGSGRDLPGRGSSSDECPPLRDCVDQPFVSETRHGMSGAGSTDSVLLDEVRLAGQCLVSGQLA